MKIVALAGGVGGAKLADGLARADSPRDLTVVVNTGDDFEHWGLRVSPDLDTVCYTLAGLANPETGWGRSGESWNTLRAMQVLGAPNWFHIGDLDLATHIERTRALRAGSTLSEITRSLCRAWGVASLVLPMTDDPVATLVDTVEFGELPFQEYFVLRQCAPRVSGFRFSGVEASAPAPGVIDAIHGADAIILCPSNPWVSIDPILAVPGVRDALGTKTVVAVSPIIGGQAVKGPAAKMFAELGLEATARAVAEHYRDLIDGFVLDQVDADLTPSIEASGPHVRMTDTWMRSVEDRGRLARDVLHFVERLLP